MGQRPGTFVSMTESEATDWRRLLTPGERAWMLDDIARVALAAGAELFPEQPWQDLDVAARSLVTAKSPLERLSFIEFALPLLTQAAHQIRRSPLTTAVSETRPVTPPILARRVGTQAILQAARRGPVVRSLDETVTVLTADTPENRAIKSFLWTLSRDCDAIARLAAGEGETEAVERAKRCAVQILGLLAEAWWEEVTLDLAAWTKPPTQRATVRPEYAAICREMARYRASFGFDWSQPLLTLPPRETWRLYETWCLFRTLDALLGLGYVPVASPHDATPELFTVREDRLTFTLAQGEAARIALRSPQGGRLSLIYNQMFPQGERSLSHTMQPDITIRTEGPTPALWILDAKFKPYALPGEEGDDINQMHAYRDAIVDSNGRRCVARAWCLYAGLTDAPNRSRINYGHSEDAIVGALCLRPGNPETFRDFRDLLAVWLGETPPTADSPEFPET